MQATCSMRLLMRNRMRRIARHARKGQHVCKAAFSFASRAYHQFGVPVFLGCRSEDGLTFLDRLDHLDLVNLLWIDGSRIFGKDHEVGEFSGLDRALGSLLVVLPRGPDRHRLQGCNHVHPLAGSKTASAGQRIAIDRAITA